MPTIRIEGYKFRFYSSDRSEPPHVHVIQGDNVAKIWLRPIALEYNHGYHRAEINRILRLTAEHQDALSEAWYEYFEQ
jgi:hypothetical protein